MTARALRPRILRLLLAASLLALGACRPAGHIPPPVRQLQQSAGRDGTAWALLSSLTTDIGPRMGGSDADARAVAWARAKLQELGFDRVWTEPVTFPRWIRNGERAAIVAPRRQPLAATALGGSPGTGGALTAEVVGFANLEALQAAEPERVKGRIAYIGERMQRSISGAGYGITVRQRRDGPFVAARKGAVALIIRSVGTDDNRLPHTGMMSSSETGARVPSAAISNPDADLLEAMLAGSDPVSLELDLDCGFQGMATSQNVIGEYDGREANGEFVEVGGHLDSWDLGTGAIDDAVGVAEVVGAAHLVAQLPRRPRRGIRVVLFANEEQGVYGGEAYAAAHEGELGRHAIGAESDLGSGRVYQFRSRVSETAQAAMRDLADWLAPLGIPLQADQPADGGADVGPMRKLGMPVVDLDHDARHYFDLHHTANDTLDKVNLADLRFNLAAYATFIWFAAESTVEFGPVAPSK